MANEKLNPSESVAVTDKLSAGMSGLVIATKSAKALKKVLADDSARNLLTTTMNTFVAVDMRFHVGMRAMGEMLYNILKLDEDIQRKAIQAICEAQGVAVVEETGRKGFAMALFAKFPEMAQMVKGGKDTKGALRLSSYLAAYKVASGKTPHRASGSNENGQPRSASALFLKLWTAATSKDQAMLTRLAGRAGIDYEDWLPEDEDESATGENEAKE